MRLPFLTGWFDFVALLVIIAGGVVGKRRGLSMELIPLIKWLIIIQVCGRLNEPIGGPFARWAEINPSSGFVLVYLALLAVLTLVFYLIRVSVGEKLMMKDLFGQGEYYLGMVAGALRFGCILFVCLAVLNAKYITDEELDAMDRAQAETLGSIRLPTVGTVQRDVFRNSSAGRFAKHYFGSRLIAARPPAQYEKKKIEGLGKKMENAANEALETDTKK
ncbi:MAG: CvpA family protein [Verrucomicrobiota bacterium]